MAMSPSTITKQRILCLHGKNQSGAIMSNKIGGARRKLARVYDLHFLDAPVVLPTGDDNDIAQLAWWLRDEETGKHSNVQEAFDYVVAQTNKEGQSYDAIVGFSQGGALATALALSGALKSVRAVITAGAPYIEEAFEVATILANNDDIQQGLAIPKLHFAGETDVMVPVDSTRTLCEKGGTGELTVHVKGHLFPTNAVHTNYMMEFLAQALGNDDDDATKTSR
jgi:predicted esterase